MSGSTDLLLYVILPYVVVPLAIYIAVLFALNKKGWLGRDKPFALLGPILMVKTLRGRGLLERLSRLKRFWNAFGDLGIVLALVGMVAIFALLLIGAWEATSVPAAARPQANTVLAIPGLNPFLPLGYGLLALIVAVVLHEFCHGILARANGIRVRSLGVLFLVIPLGAFVEQDDEDMTKAPARARDRVAAAGVMANFALALVFFLILSGLLISSVHVKADGVGILGVLPGTPAANTTAALGPDALAPGDIITAVNGTATPPALPLEGALGNTHPGQTVAVQWYSQHSSGTVSANIQLASALHFPNYFSGNASVLRNISILGISETPVPPSFVLSILSQGPFATGASSLVQSNNVLASSALFLGLPFYNEMPIQGTMAQFYTVSGPLGAIGASNGWMVVNALYWLVWVNMLLGVFNALPAVPLDGGFLFRDIVTGAVKRLRPAWSAAQRDGAVNTLSIFATLIVFFLIIWEIVGPYLFTAP